MPKNDHAFEPPADQLGFTSYPPEVAVKVDELIAALPAGEERDQLIAEMKMPQPDPQGLRQILTKLIIAAAGREIVRLASEAMKALFKAMDW
jgi:hypothetical protein